MTLEEQLAMFDNPVNEVTKLTKAQKRQVKTDERKTRTLARTPKPVTPKNDEQELYKKLLETCSLVIASGPPGSGKTYLASRVYARMLLDGKIEKVYVARPNVSKPKHRMGFLPGGIAEKSAPWMAPVFEAMKDEMGATRFETEKKAGNIEEVPFEFIQGRTLKNAAAIIDEVENLDFDDFYITLTRQGDNLYMAMCGDVLQARIPDTGLPDVIKMAKHPDMEDIGIIEFTKVVRSKQAEQWVRAFLRARRFLHNDHTPEFMRK